jgi:dipeptidase E
MIKKQVIAMGGGGFSMEPDNPLLDEYVIRQARQKTPSVCFFSACDG